MSMRALREVKKVTPPENPPANGIVVTALRRNGLGLGSVGLLTFCTYSPDLHAPAGWWTLRRSLEGNGKAATVSALLRRRPPFGAFDADAPSIPELEQRCRGAVPWSGPLFI